VSPRRVLDNSYRSFLELVAGHIATSIADETRTPGFILGRRSARREELRLLEVSGQSSLLVAVVDGKRDQVVSNENGRPFAAAQVNAGLKVLDEESTVQLALHSSSSRNRESLPGLGGQVASPPYLPTSLPTLPSSLGPPLFTHGAPRRTELRPPRSSTRRGGSRSQS
jgi:hypothetical protein